MKDSLSTKSEEIDLKEFLNILWRGKSVIVVTTIIASIISVFIALSLTNIYRSTAILAPVTHQENGLGNLNTSQMGNIANLAGISLPQTSVDNTKLGIEVMKSRQFYSEFGLNDDVLVPLMASKGWDISTNELIIEESEYDVNKKQWVRDISPPRSAAPSLQEAHEVFMSLFSVSQDPKTGFIHISIDHYSPYIAKEWLDKIILQINDTIRYKEINNAELAIQYLQEEINSAQSSELKLGLYKLIQSHTEKKVLARATPEYIFEIIDPPLVPEIKIKPRRSSICIIGAIIGFMLGIFFVLIKHYFIKPYNIKKI